jgi:allophanate hydrolase subunit 2
MKPVLEIVRPAVATTIQDRGRYGHRSEGLARSGAMDQQSLEVANQLAGAQKGSAAIEFGPGPFEIRILEETTIAFAGALRDGAPWWETIEGRKDETFTLKNPSDGNWSYLAISGGIDALLIAGSRSTNLREGIGNLIESGHLIRPRADANPPAESAPLELHGPIRFFGDLPGKWSVSGRIDRMGYQLEGSTLLPGPPDAWSEPMLPGCVQIYPSGIPVILMSDASTVGGYLVTAVILSSDLRFVAQTRPGGSLDLTQSPDLPTLKP